MQNRIENNSSWSSSSLILAAANEAQSTHNVTTSNAAALLVINLMKKYVSSASASVVSSCEPRSISVKGDAKAESKIDHQIRGYMMRPLLSKEYLHLLLNPNAPLDIHLDRVTLVQSVDGVRYESVWYLPLREVFATVLMALYDTDKTVWPVPAGSTAKKEQMARLREFDRINEAVLMARPCTTGVRHAWLMTLDGYMGKRLPLNAEDVLMQSLRQYIIKVIESSSGIKIPDAKDPSHEERPAFEKAFKTIFLPWLLSQQMPQQIFDRIMQQGGSQAIEHFIHNQFEHIGCVPDTKTVQQIKGYCSEEALKSIPCDFTPFLATLAVWLKTHAQRFLSNPDYPGSTAKEKLAKQIIDWLGSEGFGNHQPNTSSSSSSSSSAPQTSRRDGMEAFYQLERLFNALNCFEKNKTLLDAADLEHEERQHWINTSALFERLLSDQTPILEWLLADVEIETHLRTFQAVHDVWKQNSYADFIGNFFSQWFATDDTIDHSKLFISLAEIYFNETSAQSKSTVIFVSDEQLEQWKSCADSNQVLHLDLYQVNRILLHALAYPDEWSPSFREFLGVLISFIRSGPNEAESPFKLDLVKYSWPDALLTQIDRLIARDDAHQQQPEMENHYLNTVLTPALVSPNNSLRVMRYLLSSPAATESVMRKITTLPGFDASAHNNTGLSPLYLAVLANKLAAIALLVNIGADVNIRFRGKFTPLHYAQEHKLVTAQKLLLGSEHIDLNASHSNGETALMIAIKLGDIELLNRLLSRIQPLSSDEKLTILQKQSQSSKNALMIAVRHNPAAIAPILACLSSNEKPALLQQQNVKGRSVLMFAARKENPAATTLLLEGLDREAKLMLLQQRDIYGTSALMFAAENNPESIAPLLKGLDGEAKSTLLRHQKILFLEMQEKMRKNGTTIKKASSTGFFSKNAQEAAESNITKPEGLNHKTGVF